MILATTDYRRIMAGIAEVEMTIIHVQHANPHGDEHAVDVIIASKLGIHVFAYLGWHQTLVSHSAEKARGLSHEERSGNSLTTYIAYGKVEHIATNHIAVEVASNLLGGSHRGVHVEALAVRELVGYHRHLDVARNLQLALDTILNNLQLSSTAAQNTIDDEEHNEQHEGDDQRCDTCLEERSFFLGYLSLLILRIVDGGQLGCLIAFRPDSGRI